MVAGALISAGAGLLGGLFNRKSDKKAAANALYQHRMRFKWTRADAEAAGFNPLTALGTGAINAPVAGPSHSMGNAIAQAGLAISGGIADREELNMEKSRLEMDKKRLDALIENQTIRPKVGGVYAQRYSTPTNLPMEQAVDTRPDGVRRATTGLKPLQQGIPGASKMDTAGRLFETNYNRQESPFPMLTKTGSTMIVDETGYPTTNLEDGNQPPELEADAYTLARQHELPNVAWPMLMGNIQSARGMLPDYHPFSTKGAPQRIYDALVGDKGKARVSEKIRKQKERDKRDKEAAKERRKKAAGADYQSHMRKNYPTPFD